VSDGITDARRGVPVYAKPGLTVKSVAEAIRDVLTSRDELGKPEWKAVIEDFRRERNLPENFTFTDELRKELAQKMTDHIMAKAMGRKEQNRHEGV